MDPNANLREQEHILITPHKDQYDYARLRELRSDLERWLNIGGDDPTWSDYPLAARYFGR